MEIFMIEIMNRSMLDHYLKLGSTKRPFRSSTGLLNSAHSRSRLRDSGIEPSVSRANA